MLLVYQSLDDYRFGENLSGDLVAIKIREKLGKELLYGSIYVSGTRPGDRETTLDSLSLLLNSEIGKNSDIGCVIAGDYNYQFETAKSDRDKELDNLSNFLNFTSIDEPTHRKGEKEEK